MTTIDRLAAANLDELQTDLAARTGRGINATTAGIVLWAIFAALGAVIADDRILALFYVLGAGLLFPFSLVVAKVMKLDTFAKGNPIAPLAGLLGAVQILYIPLMIGALLVVPHMVPWFLAVLVGAHFLPYAWLFRSRAYVFASVSIPLAAGAVGWLLPDLARFAAPGAVVVLLAITTFLLARENRGR